MEKQKRIPKRKLPTLTEYVASDENAKKCYDYVVEFFAKEPHKVDLWFNTKNPLLGEIAPLTMLHFGRSEKLLKFIESCRAGYFP